MQYTGMLRHHPTAPSATKQASRPGSHTFSFSSILQPQVSTAYLAKLKYKSRLLLPQISNHQAHHNLHIQPQQTTLYTLQTFSLNKTPLQQPWSDFNLSLYLR